MRWEVLPLKSEGSAVRLYQEARPVTPGPEVKIDLTGMEAGWGKSEITIRKFRQPGLGIPTRATETMSVDLVGGRQTRLLQDSETVSARLLAPRTLFSLSDMEDQREVTDTGMGCEERLQQKTQSTPLGLSLVLFHATVVVQPDLTNGDDIGPG
jgi:hypothetical protein